VLLVNVNATNVVYSLCSTGDTRTDESGVLVRRACFGFLVAPRDVVIGAISLTLVTVTVTPLVACAWRGRLCDICTVVCGEIRFWYCADEDKLRLRCVLITVCRQGRLPGSRPSLVRSQRCRHECGQLPGGPRSVPWPGEFGIAFLAVALNVCGCRPDPFRRKVVDNQSQGGKTVPHLNHSKELAECTPAVPV